MCDTFVAMPSVTRDGGLLFAKNSDRDPNEAQEVVLIPAADHEPGSKLKATYIEIPQVSHTYGVLLCKPFWIWGAEMGANEHGVVIGNEAVFSRIPADKEPGLIGMDYLRLGLERGKTAVEALNIITVLLEQYGQSGNCGYQHELYYHNSYLIADSHSAYVLETVGKNWAVEKVTHLRSISNQISITSQYDSASTSLVSQAVQHGWCANETEFDFHKNYSDLIYTKFSDAQRRSCESMDGLAQHRGTIDESVMFSLLRHHRNGGPSTAAVSGADICMHAGYGPIRGSQTTGSLVAHLTPEGATYWITATSAPCTGIFKPVWFEAGLPSMGEPLTGDFNPHTLWWHHEMIHRQIMMNYEKKIGILHPDQDAFEAGILEQVKAMSCEISVQDKYAFSQQVFARAAALENSWLQKLENISGGDDMFPLYRLYRNQINKRAGFQVSQER